ncbi:MAG: DUF1559 domain-containing protein [Armatimonadetes bacterium]|nr:DUF1559 domain-containing protein [Armatimonadota bacterium]
MSRRATAAFTLIELLVVIAIIAILAAILFPVFAQAREEARKITCVSNLKQIALASQMYEEDYDETLVPAGNRYAHSPLLWYECGGDPSCMTSGYWTNPGAWVDWGVALYPYEKDEFIYTCPDIPQYVAHGVAMNTDSSDDDYPGPPSPPGVFVGVTSDNNARLPGLNEAQIVAPADLIVFYDSHDSALEGNVNCNGQTPQGPDTEAWETMDAFVQGEREGLQVQEGCEALGITSPWRHQRGFNVAWGDGHAKWVMLGQLQQRNLDIQDINYTPANDPNWPE